MADDRDRMLPERWESRGPWSMFDNFRRRMESMMQDLDMFGGGGLAPWRRERSLEPMSWQLDMDLRDLGDHYELSMDLPGVDKENVSITINEDSLVVQGERRSETHEEHEGFLRSERYFGNFSRRVPLPVDVDPDAIDAEMTDGVLRLNLPKSEDRRGRRIDIR